MAQLSSGRVDIISRENGTLLSQNSTSASRNILLSEPSVVRINGTRAMVTSFERQGDDLILHMQDGSVVRYQRFFLDENGLHSELVFDDGVNAPEHALFPVTSAGADATTAMTMTPTYESLGDIDPLLLADNGLIGDNLTTAAGIAGVLGLAGIGVASAGGGGGGGGDNNSGGGDGGNGNGDIGGDGDGGNGGGDNGGDGGGDGGNGGGDNGGDGGGDGGNGGDNGGDGDGGAPEPVEGTITITEPISGDGYLNAGETQTGLIISGTTTGVNAGSSVTLNFNGVNYPATVGSNGSWSISIPASALAGLENGAQNITVSVIDASGATVSDSSQVMVVVTTPQPSIDTPFTDGTLGGTEAGSDQTLTGNTGITGAGQSVSVTIGDNTYTVTPGSDGSWSLVIPAADLQALPQGTNTIAVTVTDVAGNTGTTTSTVNVNTAPATGTVDTPISGDNLLSGDELQQDLLISGTGTEGDRVTVTFNGVSYFAVVGANGRWVATIPASALADLDSGDYPVTVAITNAAGTTTVISETPLTVDPSLSSPTLTLDPIAGDNILSGPEQEQPLTLTGSGSPGDTISVTLNGNAYPATVASDGSWSVTIPASDLAALADGDYLLSATATSSAGAVITEQSVLTVDTAPPALTLDAPLAGDGYLNNAEAGVPLTVTGTAEAGSSVIVTLNGTDYTVTVPQNGQWSVSIPAADLAALPDGSYSLTVSATDATGNVATSSSPLVVIADPATLPTITLDPFTGDNVLDSAERGVSQTVTGTADNVAVGSTITVTLNGTDYTGTVQAGGVWSVTVPADDLAALDNGSQTLEVTVSDAAGNSASASDAFTVQPASGGALAIAPVSEDNYLNAQEAGAPLTISGSTSNVTAGSVVTVTLNGVEYTGTVGADGGWSVTVSAEDLTALEDGAQTITASVPDGSGGTASSSSTLNVATTPLPEPVVETPFGDGVLSGAELTEDQTLSGSTGISGDGQAVTVTLNDKDYPATVDGDGNWTVTVPSDDLQALPPGSNPVTVTVTDTAGNTASTSVPVTVDTTPPILTINTPAGDGVVNANEQGNPLIVSGATDAGNSVTLTFNGENYPATVSADGSWSVSVPASVVQALGDGRYDLSVTATRSDGSSVTALEPVEIATAAPAFTLDPLADDSILNAAEQGQPLSISGTGSAGDSVTVTLNGVNYATRVGSDGSWSVSVPAADLADLTNGASYPVNVLVVDANGNRNSEQSTLRVDTAAPALTIDPPSGDGLLNAAEQQQPLTLTGSGEAGSTITVTIDGKTFTGTTGVNGLWSVEISSDTLSALDDGPNAITVTQSDAAGNVTSQQTTLTVDASQASLPAVAITVDTFAGNGVLDSAERQVAQVLTGTTSNVEAGQTVTVTLNGVGYTGVVDGDGSWRVTLPAEALNGLGDGSQTLTVTVNDAAGNSASAGGSFTVNTASSGIALAPLAGDGYLNAAEAAQDLVINGTSANVPVGAVVQVTFNGENYSATVNANGSWSVTVPAGSLSGLADGPLAVTASVTDATGATITTNSTLNVAVVAQPTLTVDTPFGDGSLSAADVAQDGVLTGNTGVSGNGQSVTVTLDGNSYTGTVAADGSWSVTLPSSALSALDEGANNLAVTVSDAAGNSVSGNATVTVDTSAPSLTLTTPVSGGTLNASEVTQPLDLNGSGEAGSTITVSLNGADYTTTVGDNGQWTLAIPAADLGALPDGSYTLSVTGSDAAGNATTVTSPLAVKAAAASQPTLSINDFAGNNILDGAEQQTTQLLSGSTTNTEPGQIVTITLNGQTYNAVVQPSGLWSVSVPAADLAALANGTATISATVSDAAGNTATQTLDVAVNNALSGISVAPLSGDGYLNYNDVASGLLVSGSSANLAAGTPVTVTFNDRTYTGTVDANGDWSVTIPATALAGLPDGTLPLTVSATDAAGNAVSNSSNLTVIVNTLPDATLQTPFGDGLLNAAESAAPQQLQGNTGITGDGQSVTVNLNGVDYSGTVDANGNWSVSLPASALGDLPAGDAPLLVTVSDAAGNTSTVESSVTVDRTPPTLTVEPVAGDNRINAVEAAAPVTITGSTTAGEGQTVTVSLNGQSWTTQVDSNGDWTLDLPAGALAGIDNGNYPLSVTVSDAAGNPVTSNSTLTVQNSVLAPTINMPFGDGYLNSAEAEISQTLSGNSGATGAGQSVVIRLDGVDYPATVNANGNWTLSLDADTLQDLAEGTLSLVVTATDASGNVGTVEHAVTIDYSAPSLSLNAIATDNILNAAETLQDLVISGTAGTGEAGQTVTVNFNGQTLQTVVLNNGTWQVTVPASVLQTLPDGETPVSVTLTDAAGNSTTVDRPLTVVADPADLPELTLDAVATDGYLSQAEAGQPLTLTGSSTALQSGQTVTVTLNGVNYTGSVDGDGNWSVTVPQAAVAQLTDGTQNIIVQATDVAGNPTTVEGSFTVIASAASQPTITVNPVTGDDIVNAQEASQGLTLTGSSQRLPAGTGITVTLNGQDYATSVDANGNWSVTVPPAAVQALPQGNNSVTVSGADVAGNPAQDNHPFTVDTAGPILFDVEAGVGTDGILNQLEALAGINIVGVTAPGQQVIVTLNGRTYTGVADGDGGFSIPIPSGDLQQLSDGSASIVVSVSDANGNVNSDSVDITVALNTLPALTLNAPFGDGVISAAEAAVEQTLSGTAVNLAEGTAIRVAVGTLILTTTVDADGNWQVTVPANALNALPDGTAQIVVSASDPAGNPVSVQDSVELIIATQPEAVVNAPFADAALNATEAGSEQILSGATGIIGEGQTVTVVISGLNNGQPLTAEVSANGNWSLALTPSQLASLSDGTHSVTVTVTDRAGNSDTASTDFIAIVNNLPEATLNTPFGNGSLNASEAANGATLSGNTGIVGEQTVTVTINGSAYPVITDGEGGWSVELTPEQLQSLPDGSLPITVTVTDAAGNTATDSETVQVIVNTLPAATLDLPFGNGALNAAEADVTQTLSGQTGITGAGQTVNVVISGLNGDQPIAANVDGAGNWSLNLTPEQMDTLGNGAHTITVTASDAAGNVSTTAPLEVITAVTAPDPVINTPFGDGVLNINEASGALTLSGNTGATGNNQDVQLSIDVGGTLYTGTVDANGNWTVNLPAGALSGLGDGTHNIVVTVVDNAGNVVERTESFTSALTPPTLTLNLPFGDGELNAADVAEAMGGVLTGSVSGAESVTIALNGRSYPAIVNADGSWRLTLPSTMLDTLAEGNNSLIVTATDANGNSASVSEQFTVNTSVPTIAINDFTGDNALTYAESIVSQTLSGTSTGAETGSRVTVTIGGNQLSGIVAADGSWSINVPPEALAQLSAPSGAIAVTITDPAGNSASASTTVSVDLTPPAGPLLTLASVAGDNIINASEGVPTFSGSFANLGATGGTITLLVNGTPVGTTTVTSADGSWSITPAAGAFPSDGAYTVSATAVSPAGTVSTSSTVVVDRTVPTLTINEFTGDGFLNGSEIASSQTISGTASVSEAGRTVTVTLNGNSYSAIVQANGSWSTNVPAADLQALDSGASTITATLSDAAGNVATATSTVTVDTSAPLLEVDALLGNNILNALDILTTQVLTGRASGAEGQTVGIYLGDGSPIATAVVDENGTFSIDLTPEVLGSLTEGALVLGVRVGDEAGNQTNATLTVNKVVNQALNLVVDSVFGDGFLNAADTAIGQTISGIANSAGVGATVALTLGGTTLTAAVGQDGKWAIVVPPSVLELLQDGDIDLNLTLTDAAGNQRTVTETVTAIVDNVPVIGNLNGLFGGDNLLNISDLAQNQTIGGVLNAATGSTVTVTLGSQSYQTQVIAGGNWGITIPAADLGKLLDGTLALGVTVVDPAGNTASQSVNVGIFGTAPVITLNPIFGNGFLDAADLLTNQTISGVVQNVAAGSTVNINLGSTTVTAVVGNNGVFSATVAPDILKTLTEGNLTVGASVTDAAGNTGQVSGGLVVDITPPTLNLNPLFGDGLLNAADALLTQTISGTVGNVEAGVRVTIAIGGQTLATTANANGVFSVALTPALLQGLADGNLTATVTVTDSAGNSTSATAGALVGIHNLPVITLDPLFGNGILNIAESLITQNITGTVANAAAGSQVRVNIGNTVVSATVGNDGRFSAAVSPDILGTLLNGNLTVGVSVTDPVGNVASVNTGVQVGISNPPSLTLNTVFGDGVLSAADLNTTQIISGSSSNLGSGSSVVVSLNGRSYTTTVGSNGSWTLSVPKTDLAALADGTQSVSVRATDAYGNTASALGSVSVISHTPPTLTIGSIFGDGLLNATDALTAQTITGTSTNAEGSTVTVTVAGSRYTGTVGANGAWSVAVPSASLLAIADGSQAVSVNVTNSAGTSASASGTVQVATHTLPTVTVNSFFGGDGYLNLAEANVTETISGSATNAVGRTVTVSVAGTQYTTTVASNGTWSVNVPSSTLRNISDGGHSVNVSVSDAVGNTATASGSFNAITHNLPAIGVDPVLSLVSVLLTGLTITGGTLNLRQGTTVSVTLNGTTINAVTDALGRYSAKFTGGLLTALNLNSLVTVRAVDAAGNPASTTTTLLLGSLLPVASSSEVAAMSLMAAATDDALAASDQNHHAATTSTAEQTSTQVTAGKVADSTLTTEADTSATASAATVNNEEAVSSGTTAVADNAETFTIGGVTILLADGSQQQGAEVTGSSGSDTVTVDDLNFTHIDGGAGTDTLVLNGEHIALDLTTLGLKIEHIEILNLGQSGTNSVKLDLDEALNITDSPEDDLLIKGADGSRVTLANTNDGVWSISAEREVDGQLYDVYHNSALSTNDTLGDVLVQHNLQVQVV